MNAGRALILSATVLGLGLLIPLSVLSATAATCALSAPATVKVGTPLAIVGSGFPVSTGIDITIGLEGATPDQFTTQSDGAGAFTISLTPEPADAGKTTVVATAGTTCSAQAVFTVTGAAATPTPEATTLPSGSGPGATGKPPRTDTATASGKGTRDTLPVGSALALAIVLFGASGLLMTRRTVRR